MLLGSIFFPFRAGPFFRTGSCSVQESNQEVTEVASLVGRKGTKCIQSLKDSSICANAAPDLIVY